MIVLPYFQVLLASVFLVSIVGTAAADDTIQVVIETRILAGDPQAGMKSRHVVHIDFGGKQVRDVFETGTTEVFGVVLNSVRDNFVVRAVSFSGDSVSFDVVGETASGVGVVPNINYSFSMTVNRDGMSTISGCHDGYPAYSIVVEGKDAYSFKHKPVNLLKLFGSCDIKLLKLTTANDVLVPMLERESLDSNE